jgi:hypothetical protein
LILASSSSSLSGGAVHRMKIKFMEPNDLQSDSVSSGESQNLTPWDPAEVTA